MTRVTNLSGEVLAAIQPLSYQEVHDLLAFQRNLNHLSLYLRERPQHGYFKCLIQVFSSAQY